MPGIRRNASAAFREKGGSVLW